MIQKNFPSRPRSWAWPDHTSSSNSSYCFFTHVLKYLPAVLFSLTVMFSHFHLKPLHSGPGQWPQLWYGGPERQRLFWSVLNCFLYCVYDWRTESFHNNMFLSFLKSFGSFICIYQDFVEEFVVVILISATRSWTAPLPNVQNRIQNIYVFLRLNYFFFTHSKHRLHTL